MPRMTDDQIFAMASKNEQPRRAVQQKKNQNTFVFALLLQHQEEGGKTVHHQETYHYLPSKVYSWCHRHRWLSEILRVHY